MGSIQIIKAENKSVVMQYQGKQGAWIPLEYCIEYFELQEKYPLAQEKIKILEESNKDLSKQFNLLQKEYDKIKQNQTILIGVTVGSCVITLSVIAGIITYVMLK